MASGYVPCKKCSTPTGHYLDLCRDCRVYKCKECGSNEKWNSKPRTICLKCAHNKYKTPKQFDLNFR